MAEPAQIYTEEYYRRLKSIEGSHWWTLGMNDIMEALLAGRDDAAGQGCFLDVGCGSGIGLAWAGRRWPEARRIGLDVSPYALEHCQGLGAELHQVKGEDLPLPAESVDVAICIDVLQHVPDERVITGEVARVLRPGGLFYVRTNARALGVSPPPGAKLFTRRLLQDSLQEAGLQVLHCSPVNALGALVATARNLVRGHQGHHEEGHHRHEDAVPQAEGSGVEHVPSAREQQGEDELFHGGGYGGGLRLQPEDPNRGMARLKRGLLRLEGGLIRHGGRLPTGHSLVALAQRPAR